MGKQKKRRRGRITASAFLRGKDRAAQSSNQNIAFSFTSLDLDHRTFTVPANIRAEFFEMLLTDALVKYSGMAEDEFRRINHREHRHPIDFTRSSCSAGFGLQAEDLNQDAWQIAVCSGKAKPPKDKWRVYGYLVGATFYIVWFDTQHDMFP